MQTKQILSLFVLTLGVITSEANVLPLGEQLGVDKRGADNADGKEVAVARTPAASNAASVAVTPSSAAGPSTAISSAAVKTSVVTVTAAGPTSAAASTVPVSAALSGSLVSLTVAPSLGASSTLNSIPLAGAPSSSVASLRSEPAISSNISGSAIATTSLVQYASAQPIYSRSTPASSSLPSPSPGPDRESSSESGGVVRPTSTSTPGAPEQQSTAFTVVGNPGGPVQYVSTTTRALSVTPFSGLPRPTSSSAEPSSGFATSRRQSSTPPAGASTSVASPRPSASTVSGRPGPSPSSPSRPGFLSEAEQAVCEFAKSLGIEIPGLEC